ncbi:hypothetical protein MMPV_007753 [Pyropia vietnamensis]
MWLVSRARHLPNAITLTRLAATPLLGVAIGAGAYDAALGGVVLAGVSDWVDGALSRRYGWGSVLGSYLDPLADKVLINVVTVALASQSLMPAYVAALVVARDAVLLVGAAVIRYRRLQQVGATSTFFKSSDAPPLVIEPLRISKVNTALQLSLCAVTLASAATVVPLDASAVVPPLAAATAATTVGSFGGYVYHALWAKESAVFRWGEGGGGEGGRGSRKGGEA